MSPEARHRLRQEQSIPILNDFYAWVLKIQPTLSKLSKLGEAVNYAAHQEEFVRRCFSDGRFEIDNGEIERVLKKPCLGRRNFLHTDSAKGGERLATAYTLVQSCEALRISVREYLINVIEKLAGGWPMRRICELVPDRWALDRGLRSQTDEVGE